MRDTRRKAGTLDVFDTMSSFSSTALMPNAHDDLRRLSNAKHRQVDRDVRPRTGTNREASVCYSTEEFDFGRSSKEPFCRRPKLLSKGRNRFLRVFVKRGL